MDEVKWPQVKQRPCPLEDLPKTTSAEASTLAMWRGLPNLRGVEFRAWNFERSGSFLAIAIGREVDERWIGYIERDLGRTSFPTDPFFGR